MARDQIKFEIDPNPQAFDGEFDQPTRLPAEKEPVERKPLSRRTAVKAMTKVWSGSHKGLAMALSEPALELKPEEANVLGESSVDLLKAYGYDLSTHPKLSATINFAVTVAEIDGPRLVLIITRPPERRENESPQEDLPPIILP